jgi:hypothetical protein
MSTKPRLGWYCGGLFVDNTWRRQCWCSDADDAVQVLRATAARLYLDDVTAAVTRGNAPPNWQPGGEEGKALFIGSQLTVREGDV